MSINWIQTSAPYLRWIGITSDSTGRYLAACAQNTGGIYTCDTSVGNWVLTSAPSNLNWHSITSDSTGVYLAAAAFEPNTPGIYTSTTSGTSWTLNSAPNAGWEGITCDSTGQYLAAVSYNSIGIYTGNYILPVPNTNFIVNNADIATFFYPLSSGGTAQTTPTGFLYNAGTINNPNPQDLITLFAKYTPSSTKAQKTFFASSAYGNADLNQIFQNIAITPP